MFRCCRGNEGNQEHAIQVTPQPPFLPPPPPPPPPPSPPVGNMLRAAKFVAAMLPDFDADVQQPWPKDVKEGWAESMQGKVKQLLDRPSSVQSVATIFRVPDSFRGSNRDDYKPVVISLGPYHRHPAKQMDMYKVPYRNDLLRRIWPEMTVEELEEGFGLELECLRRVPDLEDRVRDCYLKPPLETDTEGKVVEIDPEKLAEMLILDACFVVEFLFKFSASKSGVTVYDDDPVIGDWWGRDYVITDMLLLENQIPFFILRLVLDIALGTTVDHRSPSSSPFLYLFEDRWPILPSSSSADCLGELDDPHHLLHLFRRCMLPHLHFFQEEEYHRHHVPSRSIIASATELHGRAVITFSGFRKGENIDSLGFHNGTIKVPPLTLSKDGGIAFLNLIAFEQGHRASGHPVTNYAVFMSSIVKTIKDVALLQQCGILNNSLGGYDLAVEFFRNLTENRRLRYSRGKLYTNIATYCKYSLGVTRYWKSRWPTWLQELTEGYFRNPWTAIGVVGAILILILSVLQTIFTIHPAKC